MGAVFKTMHRHAALSFASTQPQTSISSKSWSNVLDLPSEAESSKVSQCGRSRCCFSAGVSSATILIVLILIWFSVKSLRSWVFILIIADLLKVSIIVVFFIIWNVALIILLVWKS